MKNKKENTVLCMFNDQCAIQTEGGTRKKVFLLILPVIYIVRLNNCIEITEEDIRKRTS